MGVDTLYGFLQEYVVERHRAGSRLFLRSLCCLRDAANTLTVLYNVVNVECQVLDAERFGDVVVGTCRERFLLVFVLDLGGQQNDGQVAHVLVLLDATGQFIAVHLGHHHV